MNTPPSPYQIKAFTHVAREGSFSLAAKVLGVTQSSVTQHVGKLETVMGTQLFIRRRGALELHAQDVSLLEAHQPAEPRGVLAVEIVSITDVARGVQSNRQTAGRQ